MVGIEIAAGPIEEEIDDLVAVQAGNDRDQIGGRLVRPYAGGHEVDQRVLPVGQKTAAPGRLGIVLEAIVPGQGDLRLA